MQFSSNQIFANISRNLQRFGFGVAILASAFVGQSEAQVSYSLSDASANSHSVIRHADAMTTGKIHRYSLDQAGTLNGQITVAGDKPGGLSVFAMQGKQVVHQGTTNDMGEFALAQMTPGQYSIVIAGRNQLAAQGVVIERDRSQNANDFVELSTIQTNYKGVQDLVTTALPQQITKSMGGAPSKFQQVSASFSDVPIAKQVQIINGRIRGQVVSLVNENNIAGATIHMLQDSVPVAQVEIDSEGYFTIPDAEAGMYDMVATADSGMAAMRIEAIANKTPMKMISYSQQVPTELSIPLAEDCPCNSAQQTDQPIQASNEQAAMEGCSQCPVEYASESIGCGGSCGCSGGAAGNFSNVSGRVLGGRGGLLGGGNGGVLGGGALAGGSSLTRLLTLASLAGAVTAIADDDADPASNESGN